MKDGFKRSHLKVLSAVKTFEPKIDFESLKNEPVSTYGMEVAHDETVSQQDEIVFDVESYKAPDINFI